MPALQAETLTPPFSIMGLLHSKWAVQTLRTAVELNVFGALAAAPLDAAALSKKLNLNEKATRLLLNALTSMNYLKKAGDSFELMEVARTYLVPESPVYFGNFILDDQVGYGWDRLSQIVQHGRPACEVNREEVAAEFFPRLAANIFPMSYPTARALATQLKAESLPSGSRILDVGAGSGAWSIPFAEQNKSVHVDALDFGVVFETTKRFTAQHGVADRYGYLPGAWQEVSLAKDTYDVVILGHLLHSEGPEESARLLRKMYDTLKPGGTIVIAEFFSNEDSTGPMPAQLFAINMLVHTSDGCVFTENGLKKMLEAAGFHKAEKVALPFMDKADSPVMVARK